MITLRLDKELERSIDSRAKLEGVSKSQLIRKSLQSYLSQTKTLDPYEAGKNYFGCFSSDDADLSQNSEIILRTKIKSKHEKNHR